MFGGISDRVALLATLLVVFLTITICLWYVGIFLSPQIVLNPSPPVDGETHEIAFSLPGTPTPLKVQGTPTFPPTWTPTPTSSSTPTPTPTFTLTPVPTDTPTETPTDTPLPTNTRRPPTRTPRPPTATPAPPPPATEVPKPWRGRLVGTSPNCGSSGLFGKVRSAGGAPLGDIWVHYWADGWNGAWAKTQGDYQGDAGDRNWDGLLDIRPKPGSWHIAIVANDGSTQNLSNIVDVQTSAICEGQGAANWAETEFVRNY